MIKQIFPHPVPSNCGGLVEEFAGLSMWIAVSWNSVDTAGDEIINRLARIRS